MSGSAIIDSPIWQRLANTVWQSFGDTSRDIEAEFTSSNGSSSSSVGCLLLDFNMMTEVFSQDPVRRLSSMEAPEVIYEWEETFEAENSVWTAYSTDDCEVMEISLKACRQVTTIYIGSYNTPYVINFAARMQVNSLTQHTRWMRRLPPLTFSASPSAVAAIIAAPFQVILFSVFWSSSQYIYISCSRL